MNDIFEFRNGLVENYKKFSTSFASPRSTDIASKVQAAYDEGVRIAKISLKALRAFLK